MVMEPIGERKIPRGFPAVIVPPSLDSIMPPSQGVERPLLPIGFVIIEQEILFRCNIQPHLLLVPGPTYLLR